MKRALYAAMLLTFSACNLFTPLTTSDSSDAGSVPPPSDAADTPDGDTETEPPDASTTDTADAAPDAQIPLTCGDGALDDGEDCDEGEANSDEPDATCRSDCRERRCGDGVADNASGEACDDGNFRSHDGCSSTCLAEFATWTRIGVPIARQNHDVAYDSDRDVLVLFGGEDDTGQIRGDTWEFDGTSWTELTPALPPAARYDHKMVYDPIRKKVVLFGGETAGEVDFDDTWTWDGATWQQLSPAASPPAVNDHAMAWCDERGTIVLMGGTGATAQNSVWEFDGTTWTPVTVTGAAPSPRKEHAMVVLGSKLMIHGGNDGSTLQDTWELDLDTGTWAPLGLGTDPTLEEHGAAVIAGIPYIYAGLRNGTMRTGLFRWTGVEWQLVFQQDFNPQARASFAMFSHPTDGFVIVGGDTRDEPLSDIWSFDGTAWDLVYTEQLLALDDTAHAYDHTRGVLTVFGGDDSQSQPIFETWELDSATRRWSHVDVTGAPTNYHGGMAFDRQRGFAVHLGGIAPNDETVDETWAYDGAWRRFDDHPRRPAPRFRSQLAYAPDRAAVLLVGGCDADTPLSDTWSFNGQRWTEVQGSGPFADCLLTAAYDEARSRLVVHAERDGLGETFELAGSTWEAVADMEPPGRTEAAMAYNPDIERVVMFGGNREDADLDETWEWDGIQWRNVSLAVSPAPRNGALLTWDPRQRALVLAGGNRSGVHGSDTWLYRYESGAPDEVCDGGADEDGDALADCDDPDCDGHPACP